MYAATRQSPGGVVQKAIGGIENALWDIKARDLDVPVYELLGGPIRREMQLYWSHCGTTRVRAADHVGEEAVTDSDDLTALAKEVVERGYRSLKTNILLLEGRPLVYMPGTNRSFGGPELLADHDVIAGATRSIEAFKQGLPADFDLIIDLNFNFRTEGFIAIGRALDHFDLAWIELDCYDPQALAEVRREIKSFLCSGENLLTAADYLPYFTLRAFDIASIDVIWNGLLESLRAASLADLYGITVTPHNYYSHLATFIAAHFAALVPNLRSVEIDVDDVPWKDEIVSFVPDIKDGHLVLSDRAGWGTEIEEAALEPYLLRADG